MPTPARILRRMAQERDPEPVFLTERQIRCRERIMVLGQLLMSEAGRHNITLTNFALALRISPRTLRFHFCDLDALLGEILRAHLLKLSAAMGEIPQNVPDRQQARRAAYLAYTRRPFGGLTEAHRLLVRDRHLLPTDELESIELTCRGLGQLLAGDLAEEALLLLDSPTLDAARIEARLDPQHQTSSPALAGEEGAQPARAGKVRAPDAAATSRTPRKRPPPNSGPALVPPPSPNPHPDDPPYPTAKPGDWIYTCGLPGVARAPPAAA